MGEITWSESDLAILSDNREMGAKWIANEVGKSEAAVKSKAAILRYSLKIKGRKQKGSPCPWKGERPPHLGSANDKIDEPAMKKERFANKYMWPAQVAA